jgi:hypothetical protein
LVSYNFTDVSEVHTSQTRLCASSYDHNPIEFSNRNQLFRYALTENMWAVRSSETSASSYLTVQGSILQGRFGVTHSHSKPWVLRRGGQGTARSAADCATPCGNSDNTTYRLRALRYPLRYNIDVTFDTVSLHTESAADQVSSSRLCGQQNPACRDLGFQSSGAPSC